MFIVTFFLDASIQNDYALYRVVAERGTMLMSYMDFKRSLLESIVVPYVKRLVMSRTIRKLPSHAEPSENIEGVEREEHAEIRHLFSLNQEQHKSALVPLPET